MRIVRIRKNTTPVNESEGPSLLIKTLLGTRGTYYIRSKQILYETNSTRNFWLYSFGFKE
jgi:hypothetical protein